MAHFHAVGVGELKRGRCDATDQLQDREVVRWVHADNARLHRGAAAEANLHAHARRLDDVVIGDDPMLWPDDKTRPGGGATDD